MLHNVRHRLRIDRETWTKNFSSPFEVSPRRERERTERFRSQLRANTTVYHASSTTPGKATSTPSSLSFRLKPVPALNPHSNSAFMTPTVDGPKRQKLSVSPLSETTPQAAKPSGSHAKSQALSTIEKRNVRHQHQRVGPGSSGRNSTLALGSSSTKDRVFVYPLFGDEVPPVKSAVSAQIFHFLTNADLYNASLVNKLWSQVTLGDTVWDHANFMKVAPADGDSAAGSSNSDRSRREGIAGVVPDKHQQFLLR